MHKLFVGLVTMKDPYIRVRVHMCIKFSFKSGKHFAKTFQLLNKVYKRAVSAKHIAMSTLSILKRAKYWSNEDYRSERSSTLTDDDHAMTNNQVNTMFHANCHNCQCC